MSGHSRWWMAKDWGELSHALGGDVAVDNMIQFVQGYILAMEDVLQDLERFRAECDSDDDIIYSLERRAEESRDSARRTLDALTKKVDDAAE